MERIKILLKNKKKRILTLTALFIGLISANIFQVHADLIIPLKLKNLFLSLSNLNV